MNKTEPMTAIAGGYRPLGGGLIAAQQNTVAPDRQSHVDEQVARLESLTRDLANIVEALAMGLSSVTIHREDELNKAPHVPEPMLVPLANRLREIGHLFEATINRVRLLQSSIEL